VQFNDNPKLEKLAIVVHCNLRLPNVAPGVLQGFDCQAHNATLCRFSTNSDHP